MDSNKTGIEYEQFNGDELSEPETDEQFTGDELSEPETDEQFTGDELSEPESDERFTGDELSEPESKKIIIGKEIDGFENDKRLTGKEHDKTGSKIENKTIQNDSSDSRKDLNPVDEELTPTRKKKFTAVHKISGIVILVCLIASCIYFFILRQSEVQDKPITANKISAKIENQALVFETFIVPFEGNKYYTYMLVDVSFDVPVSKTRFEMIEKQNELRKIIYDILLNEIGGSKSLPPVIDIKNNIKSGVNAILEKGKIEEVFITKYNAV
ncbi:MAG: hypothetical protein KJ882_08290 [Proteobacteria bacterium]|nr:hypothetical protein [Pseudomonadota bacterium]MBU4010751.1 hypothetical protein [Pseudomonadota bacterium]MBU4035950.1 hypothetical protein [Pseudomonadota bacterium]